MSGTSGGIKITKFTSYIFGGLIKNQHGQLQTSNDLVVVHSKRFTHCDDGDEYVLEEYKEVH